MSKQRTNDNKIVLASFNDSYHKLLMIPIRHTKCLLFKEFLCTPVPLFPYFVITIYNILLLFLMSALLLYHSIYAIGKLLHNPGSQGYEYLDFYITFIFFAVSLVCLIITQKFKKTGYWVTFAICTIAIIFFYEIVVRSNEKIDLALIFLTLLSVI